MQHSAMGRYRALEATTRVRHASEGDDRIAYGRGVGIDHDLRQQEEYDAASRLTDFEPFDALGRRMGKPCSVRLGAVYKIKMGPMDSFSPSAFELPSA